MHDFRSALLQLVDDLHACEQALFLPLEPVDFLDTALQLVDFIREPGIAALLPRNHLRVSQHGQHDDCNCGQHRSAHCHAEVALASLAFFLAPGE